MISLIKSLLIDLKNILFKKKFFFSEKPLASKEYYLDTFKRVKSFRYNEIDKIEENNGYKIDTSWLNNLALHTQVVKKESEINFQHGRVLYSYLIKYISENNIDFCNILEIGTARGFSSICMSKALNDFNTRGNITTIDLIPHDIKMYWNCIDDLESKKTRKELLTHWHKEIRNITFLVGPSSIVLKKLKLNRIHFAFIDGMHDYLNVKREFEFISKRQIIGDFIIFDDYSKNFPGIIKLVENVKKEKNYKINIVTSAPQRSYTIAHKLI